MASVNSKFDLQGNYCTGKQKFLTFERAKKSASRSSRAKGREGEHYQPYRCRQCQAFHVGTKLTHRIRRMKLRIQR